MRQRWSDGRTDGRVDGGSDRTGSLGSGWPQVPDGRRDARRSDGLKWLRGCRNFEELFNSMEWEEIRTHQFGK